MMLKQWKRHKEKQQRTKEKEKQFLYKHCKNLSTYPLTTAIALIVTYFLMDGTLLNISDEIEAGLFVLCLFLAFGLFYSFYVLGYKVNCYTPGKDIPSFVRRPSVYTSRMFWIMTILTIIILLGYDNIIETWLPNLNVAYYQSQVVLLVIIAPIMEELTFRFFLYEKWAKPKFGPKLWKSILITSLIFVVCHPVTNLDSLVLYWVPTLLFYLVYESFGLYGAIFAHMIFNFIAL